AAAPLRSGLRSGGQARDAEYAGGAQGDPLLSVRGRARGGRVGHHDRAHAGEIKAAEIGVDAELVRATQLEQKRGGEVGDLPHLARKLVGAGAVQLAAFAREQAQPPAGEGAKDSGERLTQPRRLE